MDFVLLAHVGATLFMTGVIWFVQLVHYPLFAGVGAAGFSAYAAEHGRRTTWVVMPAMTVELGTGVALALGRPDGIGAAPVWFGLGMLGAIWLSTMLVQVPRHRVLGGGFDDAAWRWLVRTNWLRTAAWTARGVLVLAMAAGATR